MHRIVSILLSVIFLIFSGTDLLAVDKQDIQKSNRTPDPAVNGAQVRALISPEFSINNGRTAVLIMDYENDIVNMLPESVQIPLLEKAGTILNAARQVHIPIIYIVVRFRDGLSRDQFAEQTL